MVATRSGTFEIAGGCAGLHFAVVALATGSLLAYTQRLSAVRAVKLLALALGVAMVTNWMRVTAIICIGSATDMRSPLVADHYAFGWVLFAVALVPVFVAARALGSSMPNAEVAATAPAADMTTKPWTPSVLLLALGGLALGPVWALWRDAAPGGAPRAVAVPAALAGWAGPEAPSPDWRPQFEGASSQQFVSYRSAAVRVDVFVAAYDRQSPGHKLIGFDAHLANDEWSESSAQTLQVGDAPPAAVTQRMYVNNAGERRVMWSWYDVRGRRELRPSRVKLLQSLSAFGMPSRSGIVILSARCGSDCTAAIAALDHAYRSGLGALSPGRSTLPGSS
jgi:EpsI family protein